MSNEIGDLKIKVGVEVDAAGAKKQHDKVASDAAKSEHAAAQKSAGFWAAAARAVGIRQKAATNESAEARTARETRAAQESAAAWDQGFARAGQIVAGAVAGAAAGLAVFAANIYESGLAISRQSQQLGVSAQEFQRWGYIAEQTGLEQQGLVASLAHLQQQAAADGDMRGASDLFAEMADRIHVLGPGTEATALAMQAFGEQGRALLPVLLQGRQGIERLGGEFDALGGGLDDGTIASIAEMDRTLNRAKQQLLALVMPIVREAVPAFQNFASKIGGVIEKFKEFTSNSHVLRTAMIAVGAVIVGVGVAAAVAFAPAAIAIGAIVVGAGALALVVDDVITTFEGGDSVIRRFVDSVWGIGATTAAIEQLKGAWDGLVAVFDAVTGPVGQALAAFTPIGALFATLKGNLDSVKRALTGVLDLLVRVNPLVGVVNGLSALGGLSGRTAARRAAAAQQPAASAPPSGLTAPGFGVLAAPPTLSSSPSAGAGGSSSRTLNNNARVTLNLSTLSGQLDSSARGQIMDLASQVLSQASQSAVDDLATTGGE